jgi:hypothetical protein
MGEDSGAHPRYANRSDRVTPGGFNGRRYFQNIHQGFGAAAGASGAPGAPAPAAGVFAAGLPPVT